MPALGGGLIAVTTRPRGRDDAEVASGQNSVMTTTDRGLTAVVASTANELSPHSRLRTLRWLHTRTVPRGAVAWLSVQRRQT